MLLLLAFRNLFRHTRRTLLIGGVIAVGSCLLFIAEAIFNETERGMEVSFIRSLTGDFAVGAETEESFGLFGNELPILDEYEAIPSLPDYSAVASILPGTKGVEQYTPIVSAAAGLSIGRFSRKVPVFGVDEDSYFAVCADILIERGDIERLSSSGVFLNAALAAEAEKTLKRPLKIGEPVTFSMYSGGSFRIRRGAFAGIHRYPASNEALDRVVLVDPSIVRALSGYTLGVAPEQAPELSADESFSGDLDDLFSDAADMDSEPSESLTLEDVESALADVSARNHSVTEDSAAWSFVLVKTAEDTDPRRVAAAVSAALTARVPGFRVLDWRVAAGSSATMLFAVRTAFYVGMVFLAFGAVLVVMNALVISVLERTGEIGSLRALGASSAFIRALFVVESLLLTVVSAAVGVAAGYLVSLYLSRSGIRLDNSLLVSLFGGNLLRPRPNAGSAFTQLGLAALVASAAWVYPVALALRIRPADAIRDAE